MPQRDAIVAAARGWLGTPYHHQASVKGAGCDCLGLVRGVWRALYGPEPEAMPPYTRDWGNATGSETLIAAACRHLTQLARVEEAAPGDVLVFRMRDGGVAKHAGILVGALPASGLLERESFSPRARPGGPLRRFDIGHAAPLDCRNTSGNDEEEPPWTRLPMRRGDADADAYDNADGPSMIHAQEGLGVVEVPLGRWWLRRAVGAFRFPGKSPAEEGLGPSFETSVCALSSG